MNTLLHTSTIYALTASSTRWRRCWLHISITYIRSRESTAAHHLFGDERKKCFLRLSLRATKATILKQPLYIINSCTLYTCLHARINGTWCECVMCGICMRNVSLNNKYWLYYIDLFRIIYAEAFFVVSWTAMKKPFAFICIYIVASYFRGQKIILIIICV